MPVPIIIPLIAVAAAVGIGFAVSSGLVADHMAPADGGTGSLGTAPDCIETLDKLPTGSSDIDNLRNAAKKAYLTAASSADAMFLKTFAGELDAQGFHDAASCMRARAASIEAALMMPAKPSTLGSPTTFISPTTPAPFDPGGASGFPP